LNYTRTWPDFTGRVG